MENSNTFSIILVAHNAADKLEQNLPAFIETASEAGAKVIVVDDMSSDETPDVLTRMRSEHPEVLYTTFLPESVIINPSRIRLAFSVGAKAAKTPYVILASIDRPPRNVGWLLGMADENAALVYSLRKGSQVVHVTTTDVDELRPNIIKAERQGNRGHRGRFLKLRRGLYDAVCVQRDRVFDVINMFDHPVGFGQLWRLRFQVFLNSLF
jgi:glycosyltransferase involved in cell wall biosynthesis